MTATNDIRYTIRYRTDSGTVEYETTPEAYDLDLKFHEALYGPDRGRVESHAPGSKWGDPIIFPAGFEIPEDNPFTDRDFRHEYWDWQDGLDADRIRNRTSYGREY